MGTTEGEYITGVKRLTHGRSLSPAQATQAARNRKAHSVCIKCRMMKQSVSSAVGGSISFELQLSPDSALEAPLVHHAEILDESLLGATLALKLIFWTLLRLVLVIGDHLTVDNKRWIAEPVDEGLSISHMKVLLSRMSGVPNVLVRRSSQQLCKLKIHEFCHRFEDKRFLGVADKMTLMSFLNGPMKTPLVWMECIESDGKDLTPLIRFNEWNNMPSRATYAIITAADFRQLNPENEEDSTTIFVASQLLRIVCRAVELLAFGWLQKELNGLTQGQKGGTDVSDLLQQLGRTLLNLRWRLSRWGINGTESNDPKEGNCTCTDHVQKLCRILYVYHFIAQRKLPSWTGQDRRLENTMYSEYPDAEPMAETLPHDESPEGFEHWMQRGYDTISEAVGE
ncbi:MAG: hypothetical protein Q9208_000549 [Pyrenodesmia sp. 3 TL-2023]